MLGLIIRGLFFAGVVGWYSTSLWRMIDGYFMEQFRRYLEDEFKKNPRMREDVVSIVDKPGMQLTDELLQQQLRETCGLDDVGCVGSVGKAEPESATPAAANAGEAGAAGKEVARAEETEETLAFAENAPAEPPDKREEPTRMEKPDNQEPLIPTETDPKSQPLETEAEKPTQQPHPLHPQKQSNSQDPPHHPPSQPEPPHEKELQQSPSLPNRQQKSSQKQSPNPASRRKRITRGGLRIGAKSAEVASRQRRKQEEREKFQPLSYDDFFNPSRKRRFTPGEEVWEFSEFDEEVDERLEDEDEEEAGVLVAELPFKPAVDIYDLERVSGEEYCPLTLEEDPASCEESRPWP